MSVQRAQPAALARVHFESEPPATVRKSNFFSFSVQLLDSTGRGVRVRRAGFVRFLHLEWPNGPSSAPPNTARAQNVRREQSNSVEVKHELATPPPREGAQVGDSPGVRDGPRPWDVEFNNREGALALTMLFHHSARKTGAI